MIHHDRLRLCIDRLRENILDPPYLSIREVHAEERGLALIVGEQLVVVASNGSDDFRMIDDSDAEVAEFGGSSGEWDIAFDAVRLGFDGVLIEGKGAESLETEVVDQACS
jgi:hypothetical protein